MKSIESAAGPDRQPVSGRAHPKTSAPAPVGDPFARLDELMSVVEALCPVWPMRREFDDSAVFRL